MFKQTFESYRVLDPMPVAKETFKWRIDLRSFFTYFCLLASLGLSCGIQDFWSSLQHVGSLVVACKLLVVACGYLVVVCGRKEQWPNKKLTQTYLWVSRSLWQRPGLAVACCRVQGTGPFEGGGHYLITSTIVWPQAKQQGGNTHAPPPCSSTENWITRFMENGHTHQNKTQFPPWSVSPIRSFHKPLILIFQEADRMKTTIKEN